MLLAEDDTDTGWHHLLIRRNDATGELAYLRCYSPRPVTLHTLVTGLPPESWRLPLCGPRLDGRDLFVLDGWQQAGRTVSAP